MKRLPMLKTIGYRRPTRFQVATYLRQMAKAVMEDRIHLDQIDVESPQVWGHGENGAVALPSPATIKITLQEIIHVKKARKRKRAK